MYTTNYNYICNVYTVHNNDISSKDSSAINTPNSSCSWELLTPQFCSCLGFWTALASCDLLQWLHWTSAGPAGVPTERPETPTRGKHTPKNHCVWNLLLSRSFFFVFIYHSWSFTNKNWQSDGTTDGFGKKKLEKWGLTTVSFGSLLYPTNKAYCCSSRISWKFLFEKIYHHRNNANNVEIPHYILPSQLSCTLHIQDNLLKNDTYLEIDKMDTILQIPPEGNTTNWPGLVQTILQDTNLLGNGFGVVKRRIHATTLGHFLGNPWSPVIPESLKTWFSLKSGAPTNNQIW